MTPPYTAAPVLAGPAFWRRNPFLASSMEAIVMTLVDGRFTAVGRDGMPLWDSPATAVTGSLGKMGTFKLTIHGQKFALVGRGSIGGMEHGHSDVQRQYLAGFVQQYPNSLAPNLQAWRDALAASGAQVG